MGGIAMDITESKQAQEALRASRDQLRALAGRLVNAQEDERRRLAWELHDDITQQLASLAMDTGMLTPTVASAPVEATEQLGRITVRLRRLAASVGQLSRQLHPSILDDLGLVKAIESECAGFSERTGIAADFSAACTDESIGRNVALALYRIVQEGLRNVEKHSRALSVRASLAQSGDEVVLSIRDSGVGFDLAAVRRRRGLGLASMEERAGLHGGCLSIVTAEGEGTTIEARLPLGRSDA